VPDVSVADGRIADAPGAHGTGGISTASGERGANSASVTSNPPRFRKSAPNATPAGIFHRQLNAAWDQWRGIAVREELAREWQSRSGIEQTLIDTLAQAYTDFLSWQERLTLYSALEPAVSGDSVKVHGSWNPPTVTASQAVERAAEMADRFNRMFLRSLRALRDLRRYLPAVIVQNAGHVNVGEQQVNMSGSSHETLPAHQPLWKQRRRLPSGSLAEMSSLLEEVSQFP
jgi:hypothetical protein